MPNTRLLTNWIESFLAINKKTESPNIYYLWSAISVITTLLGRKCYVDLGRIGKIYPHLYIILVGESGIGKKSTAAKAAVDLYEEVYANKESDFYIPEAFDGKITAASLSQQLKLIYEEHNVTSMYLFSKELSLLIGPDFYASGLESLMTALYDSGSHVRWFTKSNGTDYYTNPFVSLLGCTTNEQLVSLPKGFIERGFGSRTIFIVGYGDKVPVSRSEITTEQIKITGKLIHDLHEILEIEGKFKFTDKSFKLYDEWYKDNFYKIEHVDPRLKNYYGRKGGHMLKVAMAIHAAKNSELILLPEDIETSIKYLESAEEYMTAAFSGLTHSVNTKDIDRITLLLKRNNGKMLQSKLHKDMSYYGSKKELMEGSIGTMIAAEMLRLEGKYYILM